jgi:lauroyl/myristoyl acyltransferase
MTSEDRLPLRAYAELALANAMRYLPVGWTSAIGAALGEREVLRAAKSGKLWVKRFNENIEVLRAATTPAEQRKYLVEYGRQVGRLYAEYTILQKIDRQGRLAIEGKENLKDLKTPVIFVAPHMSNWELVGKVMTLMGNPGCGLYEPRENKVRMRIANEARLAWGDESSLISTRSAGVILQLTRKLAAGHNLLIYADEEKQNYVQAPALGRDIPYAGNRWLVARLAVRHNIDVVPVCIERTDKTYFKAVIGRRLEMPSQGSSETKARVLADQIDEYFDTWVRSRPEHWYWLPMLDLNESPTG